MTEKETHEGVIEHMVACYDPNDKEYLGSATIKEQDLKQHDLHDGDKIQYTINDHGYAVIVGKVQIKKTVISVKN